MGKKKNSQRTGHSSASASASASSVNSGNNQQPSDVALASPTSASPISPQSLSNNNIIVSNSNNSSSSTPSPSFLTTIYTDNTKEIAVGHLELGLPSYHVFDNRNHVREDVRHNSFTLGRGETIREIQFHQFSEPQDLLRARKKYAVRIDEVDKTIAGLKDGQQEIEKSLLQGQAKQESSQADEKSTKKDILKILHTHSARVKHAQEVLNQGVVDPLPKSQMRPIGLYAKLMGATPLQVLSLPFFHNKKRREEFYFPFSVDSASKGLIGGHVFPWADDEVHAVKNLKFNSFVTAGCLFGGTLQGATAAGKCFPLIKHDWEAYTKEKVTYIANTKSSLYEQLQFLQLDLVAGIVNRFAATQEGKKVIYHLPYFDYVLFGIGVFLKNQMTPGALKSLFEHIYIRKEEHTKKIKEIFAVYGITNIVIESPFNNIFNVEGETVNDFVNAIYAAFPFLSELTAETKKGFHDEFIEYFGSENKEFKGFYATHLAIKPQEKETDRPGARASSEQEAKEEAKKTAKEKAKKTARKDAKAAYGDDWEVKWTAGLEKAWEIRWDTELAKEWDAQWEKNEDRKLWESNWTDELEKTWEKEWEHKWEERVREKAFVMLCLDKLLSQDNHPEQKKLWQNYSENFLQIIQIEDLFEYANPIMLASAANGRANFETCSILPATEKQIQVGYVDINKRVSSARAKPKIVNFTTLDSAAYALSNQYNGLAFYFTVPEISECVEKINQLAIKAMRTAAQLACPPQLNGPDEYGVLENRLEELQLEIAKYNAALRLFAISDVKQKSILSATASLLVNPDRKTSGASSSSRTATSDEVISVSPPSSVSNFGVTPTLTAIRK
ncbi:MAG: hypothetical protein WC748_06930 [Legionellales bacterium]|jgi:hypothetical protein